MKYQVVGEPFPVVICDLEDGESMMCQAGAMMWMSPNMEMKTSTGGVGKMFTKMLTKESLFQNTYTAKGGQGKIAFHVDAPGQILPIQISANKTIVAQKSSYLASEPGVELKTFFQKKLGVGLFGGEGFIMQQLVGEGMAFIEMFGFVVEYDLAAGESMVLSTGALAAMDATCTMDLEEVKGVANVLFGGESVFNTRVTGPGHIWLQTMPVSVLASAIVPYLPNKN
ncbi:MAG: TIGR00266 family protein [Oscillospiraceae bacterium]|nr:TIGR00266 family protein [Oscillospiraceae bacterium]